jgi:hypothetical protein
MLGWIAGQNLSALGFGSVAPFLWLQEAYETKLILIKSPAEF